MGFHEVQFPTNLSYGSGGGPGFSTAVIVTDSGAEQRFSRWEQAKRKYDVSYAIRSQANLYTVYEFYLARSGAAHGFRFKDWLDFTTASDGISDPTNTDVSLGAGDGSTTTYQLQKKYTSGSTTHTRNITKPVADTVLVAIDGVAQPTGWTVNTTTGVITFSSAPGSSEEISIGCEFDVPVRFGEEADDWLKTVHEHYEGGSIPAIPIIELMDETPIEDDFYYGGAKDHGSLTADASISTVEGRVHIFNPATSGRIITLPNYTNLPKGGPYFYLFNEGIHDIAIKDHLTASVVTLTAGGGIILFLGSNAGTKTWYGK